MSLFGKVVSSFKNFMKEVKKDATEFYKKTVSVISEQVNKAVDKIISTDAPKGTTKKINTSENEIKVEIKTPNKEIKEDIEQSGKSAVNKALKRIEEESKKIADESAGNLAWVKKEYDQGNLIDPRRFLHSYDIEDPKNLFSRAKFESAKGYIWNKSKEYFQAKGDAIYNQVYQRIKSIVLYGRENDFFSFEDFQDDYKNLRFEYGDEVGKEFTKELDNVAENIIIEINKELGDKTVDEVNDILRRYKNR